MNKRILALSLLVTMVAGSNAFASRARQSVLGTGDAGQILNDGSFYYDHAYNIFYNPAYVNDFKNWAIVEKSNGTANAQGGFVAGMEMINVGVFMNRVSALTGTYTGTSAANSRPIDLIIGGDMGVKWGLGVTHSSNTNNGYSDIVLRAGIMIMDIEPFVNFKIKGSEKVAGVENKNKDMTIGAKYRMGEFTPYAAFRTAKVEAGGAATQPKTTTYGAGIGRNTKLAEGARLVYAVSYFNTKLSDTAGDASNTKLSVLPIDLGIEGDVATWLTLRAGVQYKLMNRLSGLGAGATAGTQTDDTTGRVGATIHANKVDIDWAFGSAAAVPSTEQLDNATLGFDSGTFTQVAVSYKW